MNTRKKYAVGIDLGTTRSVVAHLDADGRPCTIANAEGDLTTPSVVFFDSEGVIVGKEATKAAEYEPERVAQFAKRSMGELACERTVCGHKLPPEVVQALILRKLVADASLKLGEITDAVITVPAYFNEPRRKATQDAGRLIGLNVLDIINEPTAAAISFGVQQGFLNAAGESGQKETILVYDLGGGTFDVTLMDIEGQSYTALATAGDVYLGGIDWDMRIVDFVAEQFQEKFDIDPRQNEQARQILLAEAADAKHALTARSSVNIQYAFDGNRLRIPLSREQFEELTGDLVDRTILTVRRLLREAKKQWNEITRLMLVGGSTRMPMIQTVLENESGLPVDRSMSPDEAVAHGAAIYAGLLAKDGSHPRPGMSVVNVNSHDLGVLGIEPETGMQRRKVLIGRNTSLPAVGTSKFVTRKQGQRSVAVTVVEGGDAAGKNATLIGKCVVDDLPPDLPAGTPVKVSFNYGANGRLTVGASLPGTGRHARMVIERSSGLSADMLEHWRQRIESGQFFDDEEAVGEVEDLDADLNLDESAAPRADDSAIMSDEDVMEVEQFEDEATATEESPPPPSSSQTTAAGPDAPKKNAAAKDAALQDFLKGLGR